MLKARCCSPPTQPLRPPRTSPRGQEWSACSAQCQRQEPCWGLQHLQLEPCWGVVRLQQDTKVGTATQSGCVPCSGRPGRFHTMQERTRGLAARVGQKHLLHWKQSPFRLAPYPLWPALPQMGRALRLQAGGRWVAWVRGDRQVQPLVGAGGLQATRIPLPVPQWHLQGLATDDTGRSPPGRLPGTQQGRTWSVGGVDCDGLNQVGYELALG